MTTYTNFTPSNTANFVFQPTLDEVVYTTVITWNIFAQRYYFNLYDANNNIMVCLPLIGSPPGYDISLVAGYFETSTLVYRIGNGQFEVSP